MRDVHVHFLHGFGGGYTKEFLEGFISAAENMGIDEIYLLEHTHQFIEFEKVYAPIKAYNEYQCDWLTRRMNGSIESYIKFIDMIQKFKYDVNVKFGLEVCYIPETAEILADKLNHYQFDFLTGSVHWIDGWGFDHRAQKEIWETVDVDKTYHRYYDIMCELAGSGLFTGLAHPDSIKCFGYKPVSDMSEEYEKLAALLKEHDMYAENSGGLRLNYSHDAELGLNMQLRDAFIKNKVTIYTASDAHKQSDVGSNIQLLQIMLDND